MLRTIRAFHESAWVFHWFLTNGEKAVLFIGADTLVAYLKTVSGDPWVAQRFGACLCVILVDPGSSPMSGSWCMEPASPSACVSASLSLSVTIINKLKKRKTEDLSI